MQFNMRPARVRVTKLSPVGTFIFFGIFALVGGFVAYWGVGTWMKAEAARSWPRANGTVISSEVTTHRSHSSSSGSSTTYGASVVYEYVFNGTSYKSNKIGMLSGSSSDYSAAQRTVYQYAPGKAIKAYVNPQDPFEAVLTAGAGIGEFVVVLIGIVFFMVGIGGIIMAPKMMRQESEQDDIENQPSEQGDRLSNL